MVEISKYKKYFLPIGISFLALIIMFYVAGVLLPKQLVIMSRASNTGKISATNSLMIASKISAKANGEDTCKVNVFASDEDGKPVKGAKIVLSGIDTIEPKQASSGDDGKASFTIKSSEAKSISLSANIDGVNLKNTLSVVFK